MILVTGASGQVGGSVLNELLRRGAPVRAMYRSAEDAAKAPSGIETAIADYADRASLDRALDGIERVYLVCGPVPQLVEFEMNMVEACREHGVSHLVLNSAYGAGQYGKSFPSWHYQVEQRVQASGIPFTILRPETFMQNIVTYYSATIRSDQAFYAAQGDAPMAFVDVSDIGAVAATILTANGHAGAIYTLTGSEALTYADVAARISRLLGIGVHYVNLSPQQIEQSLLGLGMPSWQVTAILELQAFYTDGPGTTVTGDVQKVLGRAPILFDQFVHQYAASFGVQTLAGK
jgi:uncharacterized protein YbjT (DUF2867 family)